MTALIIHLYRFLFLRRRCYRINRFLFGLSLRGMGLLNYENTKISGEQRLVTRLAGHWNAPVVLDVGANRGTYAASFMTANARARLYAFEPHPVAFAQLLEESRRSKFRPVNVACGEQLGSLTLHDYAAHPGSEHATFYRDAIRDSGQSNATAGKDVPVITVDSFLSENGLDHVDLLKIDTEGHELSVLKGAAEALRAGRIDVIHFEFNEMNVASRVFFRDFFELLKHYHLYRLLCDGIVPLPNYVPIQCELFGYQNIIALRKAVAPQIESVLNG
jgi:FkbM family methyltransferase